MKTPESQNPRHHIQVPIAKQYYLCMIQGRLINHSLWAPEIYAVKLSDYAIANSVFVATSMTENDQVG